MTNDTDIFSVLPHKKYGTDTDTEFTFRAVIFLDHVTPKDDVIRCRCLFPPSQLVSPDNKSDFNRLLNKRLVSLKSQGTRVHLVDVQQGGKSIYSFDPNS